MCEERIGPTENTEVWADTEARHNHRDYVVSLISLHAIEIIDVAPVCRILCGQLMP